jgi:hypothetical protein
MCNCVMEAQFWVTAHLQAAAAALCLSLSLTCAPSLSEPNARVCCPSRRYHAHGDAERGRLHPPYPSGALQERYARKGGGTRWWVHGWTTTSGLHACTHAPGPAPHCCGSRCTAVGSVAATCWLLASFLSFATGGFGGGGGGGDWRLLIFDFIFSRRGFGALGGLCCAGGYVQVVCGRGRSRAPVPLKLLGF